MQIRPYILAETNWKTVENQHYEVAVLPWGACEAHNFHLPYGTDSYENEYIAAEAAKTAWCNGARIVVLPGIPYGTNTGQLDIHMTINLNPSSQAIILRDIVHSLYKHEVKKLVIFNGHGGNDFKQMIRELQPDFPGFFICCVDWFKVLPHNQYFENFGDHADEMETSIMLSVHPHFVLSLSEAGSGASRKFKFEARNEGWMWAQREWRKVSNDTGIGNPEKATAEKGEKYLNDLVAKIGKFFIELDECDLNDLYV